MIPRPVQTAYAAIVSGQVQLINILHTEIAELSRVVADHTVKSQRCAP